MNNKILISVLFIVQFALAGYLGYELYQQKEQQSVSRDTISNAFILKSRAEFDKLVVENIDLYVEKEKSKRVEERYVNYDQADEGVSQGRHIYGNVEAPFTLVEFSDLECPFCKKFHDTPKEIVDNARGLVNWQWKHMPLNFHNPAAFKAAEASECVAELNGNKAFWVFIDEVFAESRGNGQGVDSLSDIAESIGVDTKAFNECLTSGKHKAVVDADVKRGSQLGVNGTPATFIVDNRTGNSVMVSGAQPAEAILSTLQRLKKKGDQEQKNGQ